MLSPWFLAARCSRSRPENSLFRHFLQPLTTQQCAPHPRPSVAALGGG